VLTEVVERSIAMSSAGERGLLAAAWIKPKTPAINRGTFMPRCTSGRDDQQRTYRATRGGETRSSEFRRARGAESHVRF
jgi:hypothetical protein